MLGRVRVVVSFRRAVGGASVSMNEGDEWLLSWIVFRGRFVECAPSMPLGICVGARVWCMGRDNV